MERAYGPGGKEIRNGTKHFRGGANVYIVGTYFGRTEQVIVVGHHRKSHQLMSLTMMVKYLENFRAKLVYSPTIIALASEIFVRRRHYFTEEGVRRLEKAFPYWTDEPTPRHPTPDVEGQGTQEDSLDEDE